MAKKAKDPGPRLVITAKCSHCPAMIKTSGLVQPVCPICGHLMVAHSAAVVEGR